MPSLDPQLASAGQTFLASLEQAPTVAQTIFSASRPEGLTDSTDSVQVSELYNFRTNFTGQIENMVQQGLTVLMSDVRSATDPSPISSRSLKALDLKATDHLVKIGSKLH